MTTKPRTFSLGAILSITTSRLVAPGGIDDVYTILDHMTGDQLMTHQLPRACRECAPHLLAQHPGLADVNVPAEFTDETHVWQWLANLADQHGAELPVTPLPAGDHTRIDPIAELRMNAPHMQIIPIVVDDTTT